MGSLVMAELLTRSVLAEKLEINPETLRYYEKNKLIEPPKRLVNNYRVYREEDFKRMKFILMAKRLGFSLREIKELLNMSVLENSNREKIRIFAEEKSAEIEKKLEELGQIKMSLDELIKLCKKRTGTARCPIIECLERK